MAQSVGLPWSPAQMLQSRMLRFKTNSLNKKILSNNVVNCSVKNKLKKLKQKNWYDKTIVMW